jgi:hypothetical protein
VYIVYIHVINNGKEKQTQWSWSNISLHLINGKRRFTSGTLDFWGENPNKFVARWTLILFHYWKYGSYKIQIVHYIGPKFPACSKLKGLSSQKRTAQPPQWQGETPDIEQPVTETKCHSITVAQALTSPSPHENQQEHQAHSVRWTLALSGTSLLAFAAPAKLHILFRALR